MPALSVAQVCSDIPSVVTVRQSQSLVASTSSPKNHLSCTSWVRHPLQSDGAGVQV